MKTMWMSLVGLGVLLLVVITSVVVSRNERRRPSSPATPPPSFSNAVTVDNSNNNLVCLVTLMDVMYDVGDDEADVDDFYVCNPVTDGKIDPMSYRVELPLDIENAQKAHLTSNDAQENFYVSIPDGSIDIESAVVEIPDPSLIQIVDEPPIHQRRRLAPSSGTITALVLRIITTDKSPTVSNSQLYRDVFTDDVSLKWQYHKCSWGKLNVEPTTLGVLDVPIDKSTSQVNKASIKNAAEAKAIELLAAQGIVVGGTTEYANMVLYVTPPMGDWLAYASVRGGASVYNDSWGSRVAALMHETGHNLGLLHANERGEYKDHTGYMGGAIKSYDDQDGFPQKCYNAANHAQLGWYSDRNIALNANVPQRIRLAAFAHYDRTVPNTHYIVASTGNVFMQFNRGTGINSGTYEYKDYLVIVAQQPGRNGTELVKALNHPFDPLFEYDDDGKVWTVEICDKFELNDHEPDYMEVSIGYGPSLCSQSIQDTTIPLTCKGKGATCFRGLECCSGNCKVTSVSGAKQCANKVTVNKEDAYLNNGDDRRNGNRRGRRYLKGSR